MTQNHNGSTPNGDGVLGANEDDDQVFGEADRAAASSSSLFLGLVGKRYVRSLHGALHGLSSVVSLLVSNVLFVEMVVLGHNPPHVSSRSLVLGVSTVVSSATLWLLEWNKVQAWQLSTTSRRDKGLTTKQLQQFNQGRGVVGLVVNGLLTLLLYCVVSEDASPPPVWMIWMATSRDFAVTLAVALVAVTLYQYTLIRGYSHTIFVVYGGVKLGLAVAILQHSTLQQLTDSFPYALHYLAQDTAFDVACVQFGFLWYYAYSRRLVSKEFCQVACKTYHPALLMLWFVRIQAQQWWFHLPWVMGWVPLILSSLVGLFVFKILVKTLKVVRRQGDKRTASPQPSENGKDDDKTQDPTPQRRRSSLLEIQDETTKRRSSVFEDIDVGLFSTLSLDENDEPRNDNRNGKDKAD